MFIIRSEYTSLLIFLWVVITALSVTLKQYKIGKLFSLLFGISTLVMLTNVAYMMLSLTNSNIIGGFLALILGVLVTAGVVVKIKKIKLKKVHMQLIIAIMCLIIPLVSVLFINHIKNLNNTDFTTRRVESVEVENPMQNTDRVKSDIMLIMGMYDNKSYNNARSNIIYGDKVRSVYFSTSDWNAYTEHTYKPSIVIQNLGVDLQSSKDSTYTYYATVSTSYVKGDNTQGYNTYLITAKYENDTLEDFIRRKVS